MLKNNNLKISVIIPLYNKSATIKETLQSVLAQTYTDFEVIIINDGSIDNSLKIVNSFQDNRIKIISQENKGVSVARNHGIKIASNNLIAFIDADDIWFENHLEELYKLYVNFPNCGMYCSRYKTKINHRKTVSSVFNGINANFRGIVANYFYSNKPSRITFTSALLIPKVILENYNSFNENILTGEDIELWTKIGIENKVALNDKVTCIYNFNTPESLSKNNSNYIQVMDFKQFKGAEITNPDLKSFLDVYRYFFAIKNKSIGNIQFANSLYKEIDSENLNTLNKFIFNLPSRMIKKMLQFKVFIKQFGIEFSTYN